MVEALQTSLGPELYLGHRGQRASHTFRVATSLVSIDNRFGYTDEEWAEHTEHLDAHETLSLQSPPNTAPPPLALHQQLDITPDFVADVRSFSSIIAYVCIPFFFLYTKF